MSMYRQFCQETFDEQGKLIDLSLKYPKTFNFAYDVVDQIAKDEPNRTALVWCNTEKDEKILSFGDLKDLSDRAAKVFAAQGIGKGDVVMVILKRHYEYWYVTLALHKLGAVIAPTTNMLTPQDLEYRITSAEIKGIVCTQGDGVPANVLEACKLAGRQVALWDIQEDIDGFMNLTKDVEAQESGFTRIPTLATDHLAVYFTSGTTGQPKGVIHNHVYPLAHIVTAKYWLQVEDGGLHFTVAETGWAKASWGKLYGQWLCGSAVMVYDFDNFEAKNLISVINKYKVTSFCAPPTIYRYMVKKGKVEMPNLHHAATAGEALNPEVSNRFKEDTGLTLMEGFGQTECTLLLADFYEDEAKPGSMGKPSPMYHIELLDSDGNFITDDSIGELVVVPPKGEKHPGIFCGYHKNPEKYEEVWRGGVFHTGDTAWRDAEGFYWFNGRADDVIKTGGYRVGPFEIENVLMEHPAILECSVIGVPDPSRGQAIKAIIVLAGGYEQSSDLQKEIKEFANKRLAEYKWIRKLEFVDEMPKTISGKIRKTELRK